MPIVDIIYPCYTKKRSNYKIFINLRKQLFDIIRVIRNRSFYQIP